MRDDDMKYIQYDDRGVLVLSPAAVVHRGIVAGGRGNLSGPHRERPALKTMISPPERMTMELMQFIGRRKKILLMPLISLLLFMSLFYLLTEADILNLLTQLGR